MPVLRIWILAILILLNNCAGIEINGKGQKTHHLIIGIGLVTVERSTEETGLVLIQSNTLGVNSSLSTGLGGTASAGLSSFTTITIPDGVRDLCTEIVSGFLSGTTLASCDEISNNVEEQRQTMDGGTYE